LDTESSPKSIEESELKFSNYLHLSVSQNLDPVLLLQCSLLQNCKKFQK